MLRISVLIARLFGAVASRVRVSDRGEGVISTAIAVLVIALLGAAMWVAFSTIFTDTTNNTSSQVGIIGT